MLQTIKRLAIGASMVVGASAIATAPAFAASITGATVTGVNGTDYYLYDANTTNTYRNDSASLSTILTGDATSPTGNIELFANSEKSPLSPAANATVTQRLFTFKNFVAYTTSTTLSGQIGGKNISLSSLTAADWFGASGVGAINAASTTTAINTAINGLYNTSNLATQWFNTALSTYGVTPTQNLFTAFLLNGGFQRFSDPNISYVNQNNTTGQISIGLAGHYDAARLLGLTPNPSKALQASELVKVSYNGGPAEYLYNFSATNSGLVEQGDGISHKGNYEVTIAGIPPVQVPEPSSMLGLMAVGGLFAASKRKAMKKA